MELNHRPPYRALEIGLDTCSNDLSGALSAELLSLLYSYLNFSRNAAFLCDCVSCNFCFVNACVR